MSENEAAVVSASKCELSMSKKILPTSAGDGNAMQYVFEEPAEACSLLRSSYYGNASWLTKLRTKIVMLAVWLYLFGLQHLFL